MSSDQKENKNDEEKEEQPKEEVKEEKLTLLKKGDYNIHILIEEVKNLIQIEEGKPPVPIVKMNVFGKSQRTAPMKEPSENLVLNEHFYFDQTNLTAEMLDSEKIVIEVYDNKHKDRKDYFGIYEFDFGYVYNQEMHVLNNVWIGLANPESEDISKVRGYLKLSISVLHESDMRVELEPRDNELSNCLIPAQINMKYKQISFYFYRGEEFPDMDDTFSTRKTGRRCDGFIEVKYMGIMRKTKVVTMENEKVIWNQIVDIPAQYPAVSQKICLVIKDEDNIGFDIVGSIEFKINDIFAGNYNELQFVNIYGSSINKKGGIYDQMNYNAEIGSRFNGRILMKCEVKDVDSPIARVRDIDPKDALEAQNRSRGNNWCIWARIISAYFLPDEKREYTIKICIEEKSAITQGKKAIDGVIQYGETLKLILNTIGSNKNELPDIFIYLVDKKNSISKQNICFQRINAKEFHLNNDIMDIKLLPDPCIGEVNNMMKSGLLKCKICVFHSVNDRELAPKERDFEKGGEVAGVMTLSQALGGGMISGPVQAGDEDDLEAWAQNDNTQLLSNEPSSAAKAEQITIIAVVYMSKGLVAAESDGTSDPFVTLTLGKNEKKTSVKNNTMNGIWNERLEFTCMMNKEDKATWPIFLLNVFDYNKIKSNVPLGYNYLWLSDSSYTINNPSLIQPRWHNLLLPKSNKEQGQILLSFYLFDEANKGLMSQIRTEPETSLYSCEISILGLRQLKPLGMIGVKKPFIKFDLNSLNVTGKPEDAHANIQTIPVSGGANPTINTVIKFDAKLPVDLNFMPELQCEVYDNMLKGLHNSLLGVFSLDLKRIIEVNKKQIDEDIKDSGKTLAANTFGNLILNSVSGAYDPGMSEKSPEIVDTTSPESINLSSQDSNQSIVLKKADDTFIEEDDNKLETKKENINVDNLSMDNVSVMYVKKNEKISMKSSIILDGNFLKKNINDPNYFVLFPKYKYYKIPGYGSVKAKSNAGTGKDGDVELSDGNEGDKIQKEFLMEDSSSNPDKNLYFPVGYILKAKDEIEQKEATKHFRRIYGCALESVDVADFKINSPFNVGKIRRGKFLDKKSETELFDAMKDIKLKILHRYGQEQANAEENLAVKKREGKGGFGGSINSDKEKSYGKFKGLIRIAEKTQMDNYEAQIELYKNARKFTKLSKMKNYNKYENLRNKLINKTNVIIRIYILEMNGLAKMDIGSESDPYIKIHINDKMQIDERKNYQEDQKDCKWYKYYDIPGEIPGSSILKLEVWDYDPILPDDLIGFTTIDLEDRFYNDDWQSMEQKPIEVRTLKNPDYAGPRGQVSMWLEIFDVKDKSNNPPWQITPEPITELEVRFIVWETEDMEMMDVEGTSDIYVIGYIDQKEKQKTDVHYRCQTGAASFNWRMLLPLKLPIQKPTITLQVYDKDLFASDDFISGATIDLSHLIDMPKYLELPITFDREFYKGLKPEERNFYKGIEFLPKEDDEQGIKFWVQCYKGKKDANVEGQKGGRVMCSVEILPKKLADLEKVGKGRDEPNINPFLPPPAGRFEWSLNPFKMFNQCVGPKFRRKCCFYLCCILLIAYLIFALPSIFTAIIT